MSYKTDRVNKVSRIMYNEVNGLFKVRLCQVKLDRVSAASGYARSSWLGPAQGSVMSTEKDEVRSGHVL
jgi:hypothetical protein